MDEYWLNNRPDTNPHHDHEVHKEGCPVKPDDKTYFDLHNNCHSSLRKAREYYLGVEIEANEIDSIIIERHFAKHTKLDLEIQNLPIPGKPIWLHFTIRIIRFYQNHISEKIGNRCVFDPSCSRYSEMAFREKGFLKGVILTISRLKRCRPNNGGIDKLN